MAEDDYLLYNGEEDTLAAEFEQSLEEVRQRESSIGEKVMYVRRNGRLVAEPAKDNKANK